MNLTWFDMEIVDKNDVLNRIELLEDLSLELGCGNRKRFPDTICIDIIDYECVDIVGDAYEVLKRIPNNTVSAVYSYHCFEHFDDVGILMEELGRVMKENGQLVVVAPHFSNPYYYSDFTHKTQFGLYSFSYLSDQSLFKRKVPNYNKSPMFDLCKVELIFKSPKPFYFRWGIKKIFQFIFNLNQYLMEFYEENLCYIIPCYEIKYKMIKKSFNK